MWCLSQSPLALGFDIVYTACGHKAVEQLLRSVTSLILLTTLGQPDVQPINIHIISDGGVSPEGLPRSSNVRYSVHQPMQATELFLPCSTQRLYLHEHPDFLELDRVGPIPHRCKGPAVKLCSPARGGTMHRNKAHKGTETLPAGPLRRHGHTVGGATALCVAAV